MTTFQCKNHWVKYFINEKRSLLTASTYFCFQKLWDVFFHDELFWRKQCHCKTMSLEWITFCSLTKRIMFGDGCTMHVTLVPYITWEASLFGVFLVRIFPHLDYGNALRISPIQSKCTKIRTRKLRIQTLFTKWHLIKNLELTVSPYRKKLRYCNHCNQNGRSLMRIRKPLKSW